MYRPHFCVFIILFLTGCAITDGDHFAGPSPEPSTPDPHRQERQALFGQPYLDPLTHYLIEYQGDPARAATLKKVRQERDQRCETVAAQYADEPATEAVLKRYNASYGYSCPEQVALFEKRVSRQKAQQASVQAAEPKPKSKSEPEPKPKPESAPVPDPDPVDSAEGERISDQALSDCYLLTSIRNFSAARKACNNPADNGDIRSQANMATIAYAFEDYTSALTWAEKAAPASGDAAFLLGQMYARGRGISQDTDKAVYWYNEAARQGHKEAQAELDRQLKDVPAGDI